MSISELLEKCRAATGGSRELDGRIAVAVGAVRLYERDGVISFFHEPTKPGDWPFLGNCKDGTDDAYRSLGQCQTVEHYTESVDAILSLIKAKLPGWGYACGTVELPETADSTDTHWARVFPAWKDGGQSKGSGNYFGMSLSLAVCCAFLAALSANGGQP